MRIVAGTGLEKTWYWQRLVHYAPTQELIEQRAASECAGCLPKKTQEEKERCEMKNNLCAGRGTLPTLQPTCPRHSTQGTNFPHPHQGPSTMLWQCHTTLHHPFPALAATAAHICTLAIPTYYVHPDPISQDLLLWCSGSKALLSQLQQCMRAHGWNSVHTPAGIPATHRGLLQAKTMQVSICCSNHDTRQQKRGLLKPELSTQTQTIRCALHLLPGMRPPTASYH